MLLAVLIFVVLCLIFKSFYVYYRKTKTSLKDKHVVITGGSMGIGKALAVEAVKRGAHVTIIARNKKTLQEAVEYIEKQRLSELQIVTAISLDINTNYEDIVKVFNEIEKYAGPIYMLFNNAGTAICGRLEDLKPAEIQRVFTLNSLASMYTTKAVVSGMKERNEGHIVFISSLAAFIGIYGFTVYSASKFAIRGFAEALQMELETYNINVTVSYPPDTDTPGFEIEEKTKPTETKLISGAAGLVSAEKIAKKTFDDSLAGSFQSTVGLEGFMLKTLCAGMSPISYIYDLFVQFYLMGFFRLIALLCHFSYKNIIKKCKEEKNKNKKKE